MQRESQSYLSEARQIIRKTPNLIGVLVVYTGVLGLPGFLLDNPTHWSQGLTIVAMIAHGVFSLIVYPVIYGKYADIAVDQKQRSWNDILRNDWWNLFVVNIVLNLPVLIIESIGVVMETQFQLPKLLVSSACSLFGIYAIPLVFIMKERVGSISLGVKCLLGNLSFSRYLVFLTLLVVFVGFAISSPPKSLVLGHLWSFVSLVAAMAVVVIDLGVFVAASLILVDKLAVGFGAQKV
ncbi:MAG: hypothetical protein CVU54_18970 [Deltaproteobacteria bacterium HGW-Deltaproteobacteria-12]|jgi:hypothetical protein|nr:MAG: hypothetical protein CVU54_18970 [Deltaproteobacteria bacterium HGW-Deltaproteobacteria-12]